MVGREAKVFKKKNCWVYELVLLVCVCLRLFSSMKGSFFWAAPSPSGFVGAGP